MKTLDTFEELFEQATDRINRGLPITGDLMSAWLRLAHMFGKIAGGTETFERLDREFKADA